MVSRVAPSHVQTSATSGLYVSNWVATRGNRSVTAQPAQPSISSSTTVGNWESRLVVYNPVTPITPSLTLTSHTAMFCLKRDKPQPIRLPDEDSATDRVLEEIYGLSLDEKGEKAELELVSDDPSEDEMQERLRDVRKAISKEKLHW